MRLQTTEIYIEEGYRRLYPEEVLYNDQRLSAMLDLCSAAERRVCKFVRAEIKELKKREGQRSVKECHGQGTRVSSVAQAKEAETQKEMRARRYAQGKAKRELSYLLLRWQRRS